jgi:trehalose 6-phosphate synthase
MKLIVVSNRLPFAAAKGEGGRWTVEPGSGGLVTALRPVLQDRGGCWIGWTGATSEELQAAPDLFASRHFGYDLVPVPLSQEEKDGFYFGFSNEVVWPLFHDLTWLCRFDPAYWTSYESVNRKFAEETARHADAEDFVWVHDYHLMSVARELRGLGVTSRLAFFLHIPFPHPDIFLKLPWRLQVLRALLEYDVVGFQTSRDRRNFFECVRLLLPQADVSGKGTLAGVRLPSREVRVGSFPISIDFADFARRGTEAAVVEKARSLRRDEGDRTIILGVDRLDYTKGIPDKLRAFRELLRRYPEHTGRVTLFQIVVPSREDIPRYRDYKVAIDRLVGEINGQFTRSGWVPIHYLYRSLEGRRLAAYYLAADVALVTPLKDGMNLVCKEYCASRRSEDGVLILSEFAGAAAELDGGALLVNPYDVEGVAASLDRALKMDAREQRTRMRRLRRVVREHDIFHWVDAFLEAAVARSLEHFERRGEPVPPEEILVE